MTTIKLHPSSSLTLALLANPFMDFSCPCLFIGHGFTQWKTFFYQRCGIGPKVLRLRAEPFSNLPSLLEGMTQSYRNGQDGNKSKESASGKFNSRLAGTDFEGLCFRNHIIRVCSAAWTCNTLVLGPCSHFKF